MANTFKFGNKNWAWKEGSVLAYNDENNNFKPLPFDFTRSSSATRVNKDGLIEVVGSDEPRVDYLNNADGHLLLEPSRSNIIPSSEDLDTGWSKARISVSNNETISPDGTQSAAKVTEDTTASATHTIYDTLAGSVTAGNTYYLSCFVKKGTRRFIQLREGYSNVQLTLDTSDFSVFSFINGTNYNVENYGNGWYRIEYGFTADSSGNSQFACYFLDDSKNPSYTGDGSSHIYLWGVQLEEGSYATSYIPTSGSSVTRAVDGNVQTVPSGIYGTSQGSVYIEGTVAPHDSSGQIIFTAGSGTSNLIYIWLKLDGKITVELFEGGTVQASISTAVGFFNVGDSYKIAVGYQNNDFVVYANGSLIGSDSSGTAPNPSTVRVGNYYSGNYTAGMIKDCKIYNTRLTNAQLIALTS